MNGSITEDSAYSFRVIDLFSYAEVKNEYKMGGSYARGGTYSTILVRKHGESTYEEILIKSEEWARYATCMRYKISPEEYDIYQKINLILSKDFR